MAVWRAENSMLTQKGVEILNKVKAGIGDITITRIVAGSGRVAESTLFFQTSVSGTTKPMILSQASTQDSGSELSIYITNSDFTESFSLNQIGVYVTHPDYLEEQLYHISQCDASGFDTIPVFEETPVTFGYSLFLEHGNSSSIHITVDPQGMITRPELEDYKVSVENRIANLKHSDVGAAPYGLIESYTVMYSPEELDPKLEEILSKMAINTVKFVVIDFSTNHPILGGGTRVLQINKNWEGYCVIQALGYRAEADGVVSEFYRSMLNNVWTSWSRTYNTHFKPTYTDVGATPYGVVSGHINEVTSEEDLDTRLNTIISTMSTGSAKFVRVTFLKVHPVLGGGDRIFRIDKISNTYCAIHSRGYTSDSSIGGTLEHTRSKVNGVWSNWARNYNTFFKPTPTEIGAFGAHPHASYLNLNDFVSLGIRSVALAENKPSGTSDYGLVWNMTGVGSDHYIIQYYLDAVSQKIHRRCRITNVWSSWLVESTSTIVPATVE